MKGCQFSVRTARAAPITKIRIAATLMSTMTLFVSALSRTPRTRITVSTSSTTRAGRLNQLPVNSPPAIIGPASALGRWNPNMLSSTSFKYAEKPTATAMFETAYSRMRSQPMIQAKISPSVA